MKGLFNYRCIKLFTANHVLFIILFLISTGVELKGQDENKETTDLIAMEMVSKIQTEIDPEFIYDYEHSKFVPPDGKTLLIMGQTVEQISDQNIQK